MSHEADLPGLKLPLRWAHGQGEIWALGATLHALEFVLPDGRRIRPLAEAPWHGDRALIADATIPAHLRHLGGEWPCVPFGRSDADPIVHGYGTDNLWRNIASDQGRQHWRIDYPPDRPIAHVERTIAPVPDRAAVEFSLTVVARRDCSIPVGLHPITRLPDSAERFSVEAAFATGVTFPVTFEPGVSQLRPASTFSDLQAIPLADGGVVSLGALCRRTTEEAFQLMGTDGRVALLYPDAGYSLIVEWDPAAFSTCLFWLSAQGRTARPWRGVFRGLGVEPLEATFEERSGQGAIAGGRQLKAGERGPPPTASPWRRWHEPVRDQRHHPRRCQLHPFVRLRPAAVRRSFAR